MSGFSYLAHEALSCLQEKLKGKTYPRPNFLYYTISYEGLKYGVFEFPVTRYEVPVTSVSKMKGLEPGKIYYRNGTSIFLLLLSSAMAYLLLLGDPPIHIFFGNLQSPSNRTNMSMIHHERRAKIFIVVLLLFVCCISVKGQSYYTTDAPEAPGLYRKNHLEISLPAAEKSMVIKLMDAIVDEFKAAYPSPVGAEIGPYGGNWSNYRGKSEFENGPYMMNLTIPFYELLNVRSGGVEAGGEYGSSIKIWINYAKYILDPTSIQYGNDRVFKEPVPGIPVNGFPKYNNMILVLPPGKGVPWRPATKEEYLQNYIEGLKSSMPGRSKSGYDEQNLSFAKQLLASMSPQEKKQIAYLKKTKHAGEKTGYPDIGHNWAGFIDPSDTTGHKLVIIDESFYDKSIPRTTIQCMVIDRQYPRASISAAAPTKEMLERAKRISDRLNDIVRKKDFLSGLQQLLGKPGLDYVLNKKKQIAPAKTIVVRKPVIKNLDRIVDSLMRNYRLNLPQVPISTSGSNEPPPSKEITLPAANSKKLALASRQLNTRAELVKYLDEMDEKLSAALAGTKIIQPANANTATKAAYGYWIFQQPREALLLALKAAKKNPDNSSILNNLGATLSLCGGDYLAVPLYIICIKKDPANSTLNNNIGQSYLALGQPKLAEQYLKKAIASSPKHHHANNSLGFLYRSQGMNDLAIKCYENSLNSSFTLEGFNRLKELKKESALKLMDHIKHRYKQPDYINFNKYAVPLQCTSYDQTEIRIAEHKYYQKVIDEQLRKYTKLKDQQEPIAGEANKKYFSHETKQTIRPFLPFAAALIVCIRKEFETKFWKLEVELKAMERKRLALKVEFDSSVAMINKAYEPRLDKLGEGNADPTLEEEMCADMNATINSYLLQFAELNEERFRKIIHTYKDYLNDYLYWVRFGSFTNEQYRLEYYEIVLTMYRLLREVKLTTLHGYCNADKPDKDKALELKVEDPDCPLPVGVELPFVVGKMEFDCKSWGLEIGEGVVFNIEHLMGGATTIAIGPGEVLYTTPQIGGSAPMDINPGYDEKIKGQLFVTFDANTIIDWGLKFEAEMDVRGLGKELDLKQSVTLAVNKGLTADGPLTDLIDKHYEIPKETPLNKNIKIFKPQQ